MSVTIRDIAQEAQVSASTVSLVIRDEAKGRVRPETVARVREAIRSLNYRPNSAARQMRAKSPRTGNIGCLFHVTLEKNLDTYFSEVLNGCNTQASRLEMHLVMGHGHAPVPRLKTQILNLLGEKVDGWLIGGFYEPTLANFFRSKKIPAVWVGSSMDMSGIISQVRGDDFQGSYLAVKHLLDLGHRRILCVTRNPATAWMEFMAMGARKALTEAELGEECISYANHYDDLQQIEQVVSFWFEKKPREKQPTALFVRSDVAAVTMKELLSERGLRVPHDVSIVGHDGLAAGEYSQPPLTTVNMPRREIGETAVRHLMDIIEGRQNSPVTTTLPLELVVRGSTAPAKEITD